MNQDAQGRSPTETMPQPREDREHTNNSELSVRSNEAKVAEARTAVILLKHASLPTKNEYTQWLLKTMFQPLVRKECDIANIIYLSRSRKQIWKSELNQDSSLTVRNESTSTAEHKSSDKIYTITPRTTLLTIAYEYRLVYILDLSSSLATVGSITPTILLSGAFESLRNSLEGIVQPFSLPISTTEKAIIRPKLRLTVMADCSQFASNINVIPMLAEHPTMRVFMQNVEITMENIQDFVAKLYSEFLAFQKDTASFRSAMKQKRSNLGYDLDVGDDMVSRDVSVLDAATTSLKSPRLESSSSSSETSSMHDNNKSSFHKPKKYDETSYHSAKREVWGVGKSGASLSRILHAGHFALKLLPPEGRPELILITDGALKSNVHDNTFVRQFADEDVTCHVIQVGSPQSFIPGRNFGFVPDTEVLRFLAKATGGTFTYSQQCRPVVSATNYCQDYDDAAYDYYPRVLEIVSANEKTGVPPPPNFYHSKLLFRETLLARHVDTRLQAHGGQDGGAVRDEQQSRYNFPWDPAASPPRDALRLLRYREYPLPAEFSHVIASRAREGFSLHSISFDDGTGTRKTDMQSIEAAPDLGSVRKERIQIVMTLQWQPNIVIEYRIRATWLPTVIGPTSQLKSDPLLLPSSIFNRAKAPRAEIFVRTDAEFAHMLQNWDVFRRRAQMMGVVTGATYLGDAYTAPVYAKAEKLKNYLVDIFEGDEVLKTVIGFNSKYLLSMSGGGDGHPRNAYIEAFRGFWERINAAETRPRTRSWYDHDCIDMLIGDVSPYMSPKLTSAYNQDFVSNVEYEIMQTVENIRVVLQRWADFEGEDGTFVRIMNRLGLSSKEDDSSSGLAYPVSFLEIRLRREYGRLVSLRVLYFNMDVQARLRATEHLQHLLWYSPETAAPFNKICKRPFSRLLMRDPKHFQDLEEIQQEGEAQKNLSLISRPRSWYLPVALWLTSEYIVRDYLRHMTWSWHTDTCHTQYHKDNRMMPIHDLAFQFLCQARLDQGYQLVSPRPDSTHFYQEIQLPDSDDQVRLCAIQYFIWKDADTGKITTELWMEPSGTLDQYEHVKAWILEPDRKTISHLVTFDQIHAVGRSKGKGDFKKTRRVSLTHEDATMVMMLPQLFDVATVLRSNAFTVASFRSPAFQVQQPVLSELMSSEDYLSPELRARNLLEANENVRRTDFLRLDTPSISSDALFDLKELCLRPDPLLNRNKESMAELSVTAQSYALLHYFVEHALEAITDGEIVMSQHNEGNGFWIALRKAILSSTANGHFSGVRFVSDLRKVRCFVKVFDVRSFVLVLLPDLDTVVRGLSELEQKAGSEDQWRTDGAHNYMIDIILFECVRQKPLKPAKTTYTREDSDILKKRMALEEDEEVIIRPIDWLIDKDDGLGELTRPKLLEGHFKNSTAQLTERVLRVTQDITKMYSKSFFRSFHTCLMRGYSVDDDDLAKVLDACEESSMEIDMTEFINVMTLQRRNTGQSYLREYEVQERFTSIFWHYFEPVRTTRGHKQQKNLFYYKPPFSRSAESLHSQGPALDEKISLLVDLVAYSQTPLLIRLECVYTRFKFEGKKRTARSITIPVSYLPTTFEGQTEDGEYFNFAPEGSRNDDWSPLDSGETSVRLQLICLNMPRSPDEDYFIMDPSASFPKASLVNSMRSRPDCFSSLTPDQQQALAETEGRIRWLLTEETLHGLLKATVITKPILQHVERQLCRSSPFVDLPTSMTMPFQFVKDPKESRRVFMDELQREGQTPGNYRLQRVDEYFYVSQDLVYNMQGGMNHATDDGLRSDVTLPADHGSAERYSIENHDDLCDGLGISTLQPPETGDTYGENKIIPYQDRPLYWLVLIPREGYVQMFFYSRMQDLVDRIKVIQRVQDKLTEIQERTNRLILLESLQETRICSKYLEPPTEEGQSPEEEDEDVFPMSDNDGSLVCANKLVPGQFSCPVVFTKRFPLHWRLSPNAALKYLTADVLRLFIVRNRPQMFVIERDNSIVYCKIFEREVPSEEEEESREMTLSPQAVSDGNNDGVIKSPGPERKTPGSKAASTGGAPDVARELVLQVHGICLPPWIEQEFVDLIENRLVSHITLNEVQQFFLRNPNSRPTPADVRFLLPFDKSPTRQEIFRIPALVDDPYTLMLFFKQSILMDNIKPFAGPQVTEAAKTYYCHLFGVDPSQQTRQEQYGDYCFYYNCTQRAPGTSTPLELAAGQGMAGIYLAIEPSYTGGERNVESRQEFDLEHIRHCLEGDFRVVDNDQPSSCHVWADIWVKGSVDGDVLMHYLYECFRQSLCDYFIEKTVTFDIGAALERSLVSRGKTSVGRGIRKNFIESALYILEKATEWKSPTVAALTHPVKMMPWCMDDFLDYVNCDLINMDPELRMTVAWTWLHQHDSWELYQGAQSIQDTLQNDIRLVCISGLQQFVEKLGNASDAGERRTSLASEQSSQVGHGSSRRSSITSQSSTARLKAEDLAANERSRSSSTSRSMSGNVSKASRNGLRADASKHHFLVMVLDTNKMTVYTYNWHEKNSLNVFDTIYRTAVRMQARSDVLSNILHQKMGLFHHTESIRETVQNHTKIASSSSLQLTSENNHIMTPVIHASSPKQPSKKAIDTTAAAAATAKGSESPKSIASSAAGTTSGRPSRKSIGSGMAFVRNMQELRNLVKYPTISDNTKSDLLNANASKTIDAEGQDLAAVRNLGPDRALADAVSTVTRDHDFLKRHAIPFIRTYINQSARKVIQRKAQEMQSKWQQRYGSNEFFTDLQQTEKLTRSEVAAILRSSRLLHYCRTPLLFSRYEEKWENLEEESNYYEYTMQWYKDLWHTLVTDYAKYLEGVDMHLIDVAKDGGENDDDADLLAASSFKIAENLSIDCPPMYLLRVIEGGSIICQIRLTSIYVSVMLFTLQRRYGKLLNVRSRETFRRFEETCGRFKQFIHVNSFVYDFHLRYIQNLILRSEAAHHNLDILKILRQFCEVHSRPASYARNRIVHGFYKVDVADIDRDKFYENLLGNSPRHGLKSLLVKAKSVAATVTSYDLSFVSKSGGSSRNSEWAHTLIVCPAVAEEGLWLEYFILVVYQGRTTPMNMIKNVFPTTSTSTQNMLVDPIDVLLVQDGYTMNDIVNSARHRLDTIVAEVIVYCRRQTDWSELHACDALVQAGPRSAQLIGLLSQFEHVDLREVDKNMKQFFDLQGLDWNAAFDTLILLLQHKSVKDIHDENGSRHLLLYNHGRYMDYMIHLQLNANGEVQGWMVSRESDSNRSTLEQGAVREQISRLGGMLCHIVWMETVGRTTSSATTPNTPGTPSSVSPQ